jgi:hypothetical protein
VALMQLLRKFKGFEWYKMGTRIWGLFVFIWFASCKSISVSPIKGTLQNMQVTRGEYSLISEDKDISLVVRGNVVDKYTVFTVSIINKTGKVYLFDENQITLALGNNDNNTWKNGKIYTATEYYELAKKNAKTQEILLAINAGLIAANAGRSTSYVSGSVYGNGMSGYYSGQIITYNPGQAAADIAMAYGGLSNIIHNNRNYLETLSNVLLYTSEIPAQSIYTGLVYAPLQKMPDVRLCIEVNGTENYFIFRRSDYQEIINPFIAYQRTKGYVGYLYSPLAPLGFSIGWLSNTWSMYLDTGFQIPQFEGYDHYGLYSYAKDSNVTDSYWNWVYQDKQTTFVYDGVIGAHYRILPYLWLAGGLGIHIQEDYRLFDQRGSFNDSYGLEWLGSQEENANLIIQAGLISGLGPLYLTGKYKYILNNGSSFDLGIGITW